MSDNNMPTGTSDRFSEYIGQRLKEHKIQPDDACWQEIETRMLPARKRPLLRIGMAVAAAVLAFLLLMNLPWERNMQEAVGSQQEAVGEIQEIETPNPLKEELFEEYVTDSRQSAVGSRRYVARSTEDNATFIPPQEEREDVYPEAEEEEKKEEDVTATDEKQKIKQPSYSSLYNNEPIVKRKKQNSWLVAAAVGTGTGVHSFLGGENKYYDYNNSPSGNESGVGNGGWNGNLDGYYSNADNLEKYSDIDYRVPLSFGVTVRKNMNKYIAIESGLVYTYLSTRFKEGGYQKRFEAKSGLYYLGIPLNVVGNVYNTSLWNVYLSGGFMAEKGLRSIITIDAISDKVESSTEKSSIKGVQWSINGAVGVSYRLFNEWSIYAEPRISYYFDTDQPISIRTDKPVTFGIGGGIRFEF